MLGMNSLLMNTRLDDEQRYYATTAQEAAQNVLRLLDDFLDLSRIEAGHLQVEAAPFDLPRLCDEVVAPFAPHAYEQGLWLTLRIDENVPRQVCGDPARLRQVLTNLVGNALKFTVQGGVDLHVTISEGEPGQDRVVLRFAVADTGIGVGPQDREKVFGVFRQVDTPITRRTGGSGLGLAISRQLVELMGGSIGLDSVEGVGSRFWATLPVDVLDWSEPSAAALEGLRALIADQRPEDRALAARFLAQAGADVEETRDVESALGLLRAAARGGEPYELAVVALDLSVGQDYADPADPGTPRSLAHAILVDPLLQATSVIVVVTPGRSGVAWPAPAGERAVQSITRPLSRRRLLAAVENALGNALDAVESPGGAPAVAAGGPTEGRADPGGRGRRGQPAGGDARPQPGRARGRDGGRRRAGRARRPRRRLRPGLHGLPAARARRARRHRGDQEPRGGPHPDHRHDRRRHAGRPHPLPGGRHGRPPRQAGGLGARAGQDPRVGRLRRAASRAGRAVRRGARRRGAGVPGDRVPHVRGAPPGRPRRRSPPRRPPSPTA
ncbi:hypothetical protein GCM10020001_088800 [Nonomuraea salmonea]